MRMPWQNRCSPWATGCPHAAASTGNASKRIKKCCRRIGRDLLERGGIRSHRSLAQGLRLGNSFAGPSHSGLVQSALRPAVRAKLGYCAGRSVPVGCCQHDAGRNTLESTSTARVGSCRRRGCGGRIGLLYGHCASTVRATRGRRRRFGRRSRCVGYSSG